MMTNTKRVYRSNENKVLAGVFGGLGDYFDIDPTLLRLAYVLLAVASAIVPSVIAYVIAVLVMPIKPTTAV